tara:strand:- start:62 stop:268 length:207 start_codon:yes stop_codon:yes gene_type:complete
MNIIFLIGALIIGIAFPAGIGFGIYEWVQLDSFSAGAWEGFIVWLKFIGAGLSFMLAGLIRFLYEFKM